MKNHCHSIFRTSALAALCLLVPAVFAQSGAGTPGVPGSQTKGYAANPFDTSPNVSHPTDTHAMTTGATELKGADKRFVSKVAEAGQRELALAQLAVQRASNSEVRDFAQRIVNDHTEMDRQLQQFAAGKGLGAEVADYAIGAPAAGAPMIASNSGTSTASSTPAMPDTSRSGSRAPRAGTLAGGTSEFPSAPADSTASAGLTSPAVSNPAAAASAVPPTDISRSSGANGQAFNSSASDRGGVVATDTSSATWNDPTDNRHYRRLAARNGAEFDKDFIAAMISDHEDEVGMFEDRASSTHDTEVRAFAEQALPKLREHLSQAQQISARLKS